MIFYEKKPEDYKIYPAHEISYPPHLHENIELFFCESGSINVTCNYQKCTLTDGMWMVVMPDTEHSYSAAGKCSGVMLFIKPSFVPSLSQYLGLEAECPFVSCHTELIKNCIALLLGPQEEGLGLLEAKGALYLITGTLFKLCRFREPERSSTGSSFSVILDYIAKNFRQPLTLENTAAHFGLNYSYFSRMFKKKLGSTFHNYLNELRVDYAKYMLISTNLPITDISFECGFSTQRSFNRSFLAIADCTPKQYREKAVSS